MNKVPGIYVICDMNNGKSYVGSSINLRKRLMGHKNQLINNTHFNPYLQNCFNKNHEFKVIALPSEKPEDALVLEQLLLDEFIDTGTLFNIARSATASQLGIPLSEEHKMKLSEIAKAEGRKPSEDALAKSIIANRDRIRSPEELKKMSDAGKERMKDPLIREHLSKINLGIKHTPEDILKMKEIGKNNTFSEKAKEARLAATIGRVQSQEEIAKRIASNIGRK